jgi:hypothetical protein
MRRLQAKPVRNKLIITTDQCDAAKSAETVLLISPMQLTAFA